MINFIVCGLEDIFIKEGVKEIPEETIELISRLQQEGIKFAVATGLNYDSVKSLFGKVKNDIIYICNDGGVIIYQDKIISKTPIDRLVCFDVVAEMEKEEFADDMKLLFSTDRGTVTNSGDRMFMEYLECNGIIPEVIENIRVAQGDITKITLCSEKGFDEKTYEHIYTKWAGKVNVNIANSNQAFITGPLVTKGTAIALIQHVYNISEEDTVVFGAGYSDIDMFEHSYYSYAMQSSDAQVKHAAKHIAENVNTILEDIMRM
ncbi:MAG: HAD-IIB family hydrolase [Eubacterium sp.]|nr:HAD-IIB family hydrolase [Eubacterium sp.]